MPICVKAVVITPHGFLIRMEGRVWSERLLYRKSPTLVAPAAEIKLETANSRKTTILMTIRMVTELPCFTQFLKSDVREVPFIPEN